MPPQSISLARAFRQWWRENRAQRGFRGALKMLWAEAVDFVKESTPERRRSRYGDIEFDWDFRVDTTAATLTWRERLLASLVGREYQPSDPRLFHETMAMVGSDFRGFTFIDVGSGKGRVLLMASDYPFERVIGVEVLPNLHAIAEQNIRKYNSERQQCKRIESMCMDARQFEFPPGPLLVFLFNPLPEAALDRLLENLENSLSDPRPAFVLYHNPLLEHLLSNSPQWRRMSGNMQYAIYRHQPRA